MYINWAVKIKVGSRHYLRDWTKTRRSSPGSSTPSNSRSLVNKKITSFIILRKRKAKLARVLVGRNGTMYLCFSRWLLVNLLKYCFNFSSYSLNTMRKTDCVHKGSQWGVRVTNNRRREVRTRNWEPGMIGRRILCSIWVFLTKVSNALLGLLEEVMKLAIEICSISCWYAFVQSSTRFPIIVTNSWKICCLCST